MNEFKRWYDVRVRGSYRDASYDIEAAVYADDSIAAVAAAVALEFDARRDEIEWEFPAIGGRSRLVFHIGDRGRYVTEAANMVGLAREITDPARLARLEGEPELPLAIEPETAAPRRAAPHLPDGYQSQCLATWAGKGEPVREQHIHAALGLLGEAGEFADRLKKHLYKPGRLSTPEEMADELADVAYYLAINAHLWGWTLDDLFAHLAVKLAGGHGWTTGTPSETPSNSTGLEDGRGE